MKNQTAKKIAELIFAGGIPKTWEDYHALKGQYPDIPSLKTLCRYTTRTAEFLITCEGDVYISSWPDLGWRRYRVCLTDTVSGRQYHYSY